MSDWPDNFDFETDRLCQNVFKPFIKEEIGKLKTYDRQRPDDITYIFHEHAQRVAQNARKACLHMGLSEVIANNMYWAMLPHDIGKRKLPLEFWDTEEKPAGDLKNQRRTHTDLGVQMVEERLGDIEHPFKDLMLLLMRYHHEQINGGGFHGLKACDLPAPIRLASIVEAYDGWRIWRPHFGDRDISIPGVLKRMREEKGADMFDMDLFESFAKMKMMEYKASSDNI